MKALSFASLEPGRGSTYVATTSFTFSGIRSLGFEARAFVAEKNSVVDVARVAGRLLTGGATAAVCTTACLTTGRGSGFIRGRIGAK